QPANNSPSISSSFPYCSRHLSHSVLLHFFFLLIPPPPRSTLFPYTTLFRSCRSRSASTPHNSVSGPRSWRRCSGWRRRSARAGRSEEHTSELQSRSDLVCRLLLEKKKEEGTRHAQVGLCDREVRVRGGR